MRAVAEKYISSGFACLPTKLNKSPLLKETWVNGFGAAAFSNAEGIGIICGKLSGGLECMDFDNHAKDAEQNLTDFLSIAEVNAIYKKYSLPIEKTVSGGFHLLYRCSKIDGNRKLASKLLEGVPDCFIETRGEGGYFCAAPTPGYKVVRNDLTNVATITELERAILIDNAVAMNEVASSATTEYESYERPGDIYNSSSEGLDEMISLLRMNGWENTSKHFWRRPGKKEGISATLGKVAPNVFYVFSSSAYPFELNKAYTPFQVLALLKFNGDFKETAKYLAKELNLTPTVKQSIPVSEIDKLLSSVQIKTNVAIEKPPTILSIRERAGTSSVEKRMFTLGNFSCLIGKAKSKKTFLLGLLTSCLLSDRASEKFKRANPKGKRFVLYFDTEQGEYDCQNTLKRIELLAGESVYLKGFSLRQFNPTERCEIIEHAFKLWGNETLFCVIDGIADLANAINDEIEATRVSTMLLRLTKVYGCHISTVIHQNKNDNFATGHLGSSIMKKAEIIISVTKNSSDKTMSEVNCDMSRAIDFEPFNIRINEDGIPEVVDYEKKEEGFQSEYSLNSFYEKNDCPF